MYPSVAYGVPDMYGAFAEPQYYTPTPPPNSNFGMPVVKKCECDVSNSLLHVRGMICRRFVPHLVIFF